MAGTCQACIPIYGEMKLTLTCCHIDRGLRKSKSNLSFPPDEYSVT